MTQTISKMISTDDYKILFTKWLPTGLAENIASIVKDGLFEEYYKLHYWAPKRGKAGKRKKHFMLEHEGFVTTCKGGSNRFEEHL